MKLKKKIFNWLFEVELKELEQKRTQVKYEADSAIARIKKLENLLENIGVAVDVHEYDYKYSPSWAVISIQGEKTDFIKFINLRGTDIRGISQFLHQFEKRENVNIDATPETTRILRIENERRFL